jgi:hypothetical protein
MYSHFEPEDPGHVYRATRASVQVGRKSIEEGNRSIVNSWSLSRGAFGACAAVALLAGCGEAETPRVGLPAVKAQSTTLPGSFSGALIYAGGDEASYVFSFPAGKLVANIAGTSFGTCSDRNGDVFFTRVKRIVEYAHGGTTPIATFKAPGTAYSCSVDPTNGNLAAVVFCIAKCGQEVVVFPARGSPRRYHVALKSLLYCAYDDNGDLFVDGYNGTQFGLAELAKGRRAFASIALKQPIEFAEQIQWDGKDLAIETRVNPVIFRIGISGLTARVVGRTHLNRVGDRATQSWIANGKIAVPTGPRSKRAIEILFWDYPAGGNPTNEFKGFIGGGHAMIDGVTFSVASEP